MAELINPWKEILGKTSQPTAAALSAVMEQFELGVASVEAGGGDVNILETDGVFARIAHCQPAHLAGCSISVLRAPDTDPAEWNALVEALAAPRPYHAELLLCGLDKALVWCEAAVTPLAGDSQPARAALGLRDISKHREQEARLRDDRAVLRSMFDNSAEGIYRSTDDGRYLDVNPALAKMYGYENASQLLHQVSDISHQIYVNPAYRDIFRDEISKWGIVRGLEYEVRQRDGGIIWISESARVVRDAKGDVRYYEGFIEDITPRKETERKLQISQQQLLETSRQVGMAEVATSILHNMGNALNSINTSVYVAAELVKKSKVPSVGKAAALLHSHAADLAAFFTGDPKGKKLPDFLNQLAEHLAKEQAALLRELETLAKSLEHVNEIVAMQQNYAKASAIAETVNPVDLMEDALRMNSNSLARHGVVVVREFDHDLPAATVTKHKVLQILMNLIRNAQKACDGREDGKQITLRAGSFESGSWIRMEVIDNGMGIPRENLKRLFTHGFTTRKEGHGFGLHSGALMAKELGGRLLAQSGGPGQGARFTLEFPVKPPENAPEKH